MKLVFQVVAVIIFGSSINAISPHGGEGQWRSGSEKDWDDEIWHPEREFQQVYNEAMKMAGLALEASSDNSNPFGSPFVDESLPVTSPMKSFKSGNYQHQTPITESYYSKSPSIKSHSKEGKPAEKKTSSKTPPTEKLSNFGKSFIEAPSVKKPNMKNPLRLQVCRRRIKKTVCYRKVFLKRGPVVPVPKNDLSEEKKESLPPKEEILSEKTVFPLSNEESQPFVEKTGSVPSKKHNKSLNNIDIESETNKTTYKKQSIKENQTGFFEKTSLEYEDIKPSEKKTPNIEIHKQELSKKPEQPEKKYEKKQKHKKKSEQRLKTNRAKKLDQKTELVQNQEPLIKPDEELSSNPGIKPLKSDNLPLTPSSPVYDINAPKPGVDDANCTEGVFETEYPFEITMNINANKTEIPEGQCTEWVDGRYFQIAGIHVPFGGEAYKWHDLAKNNTEWEVSYTPIVPSIVIMQKKAQGASNVTGHAAIVESAQGKHVCTSNWNSPKLKTLTYKVIDAGEGISFLRYIGLKPNPNPKYETSNPIYNY